MAKVYPNTIKQDIRLDMPGPESGKGGLYKFSFSLNGKMYTVLPKYSDNPIEMEKRYSKLFPFYKRCHIPGLNPFTYESQGEKALGLFTIRPSGDGDKKKEQENLEKFINYQNTGKYEIGKKEDLAKPEDFKKIREDLEKTNINKKKRPIKKPIPLKNLMQKVPPEGEQMSLFASDKDVISRVLLRYASWEDNDATLFWDEIENKDIPKEDAKAVLDTANKFNLLSEVKND